MNSPQDGLQNTLYIRHNTINQQHDPWLQPFVNITNMFVIEMEQPF